MAEYVFAHLLSSTQRVADFRAAQSEHRWQPLPMRRLTGPLGVAGWGSIGSRIGHIAAAFGLTVRGLRRGAGRVASGEIPVYGAAELDTFLDGLQVLVTVLPATAQTRGLIGEDELGRLAQGAVLVNVGRGDVLDERAVLRALNSGRLSRAVLDTFATEPLPPASPLWEAPRCVVTPHIAGPTDPAEAADVVARNLVTFLAGDWPEPVVDFAAGY
jgi:glyoxylate/hydroxypyruvate reductase A